MTAQRPEEGGTPEPPGGGPLLPDDVWQRFLDDDERAIRASAPREPSARQRAEGERTRPPRAGASGRTAGDAVGEMWRPEDPWDAPSWRNLDGRARLRRVGRFAGTAAAIALVLMAWSRLATTADGTPQGPGDTVLQQSEEVPAELPAATSRPADSLAPSPSSATTSAVQAG
ncbi:hypothetical protein HCJ93_06105 [Streptomyces sp. SBST2-5]|uniref:Uncharacterized protein n=1 Tax=Streptomyces composti TaxID=2720025 RepID=A0ABX1A3T9_9ACTN|nr:hypothetical protein [Streptomyces composti]NJP49657.1 hypothetical protein [Streptomyces composti]